MTVLGYELYEMLHRMQETRYPVRIVLEPTQNDTVEIEVEASDHPKMSIRFEPRTAYMGNALIVHPVEADDFEDTLSVDERTVFDAARISSVVWDDGDGMEPPSLAIDFRDLS